MRQQLEKWCKGCKSFKEGVFLCKYIHISAEYNDRCPCSDCLIKAMCNQSCLKVLQWAMREEVLQDSIKRLFLNLKPSQRNNITK